ncbi:MAG TPA: hypothetical protein VHE35_15425 [Kofleriaceae bacterium]|nr:hypothetical protein [Kofleriaceae bacterium]
MTDPADEVLSRPDLPATSVDATALPAKATSRFAPTATASQADRLRRVRACTRLRGPHTSSLAAPPRR